MKVGNYENVKQLATGELAAVMPYMFTHGLVVGIDMEGRTHKTRYCYEHEYDAVQALEQWDGFGDPPGPWIKQKPEERSNPNVT